MGRFKVGDKVTLSEKFYVEWPPFTDETPWVKKLKAKVEEGGYILITDVMQDGTYRYKNEAEDIDTYLFDEWLEPYSENIPKVLSTSIYDCNLLLPIPEDRLSVRDRFAMAALMCYRADLFTAPEYVAEKAYKVADAMMEVRKI